jgi:hypothetical protein
MARRLRRPSNVGMAVSISIVGYFLTGDLFHGTVNRGREKVRLTLP